LKLAVFITFCTAVILGGVVALPVLAKHFFGIRRQPEFVIDLLIFGGVCAVLAAILLSNHFGYTEWMKEWSAGPGDDAPTAVSAADSEWAREVRSDARLARGAAHMAETATASGEPRRSSWR
jgi:hypothetical protein